MLIRLPTETGLGSPQSLWINRPQSHTYIVLPNPFCPISAAKIAGLKATVLLLLTLLIKSKLMRLKMSLLGSFLGFAMLVGFLISTGLLTLVAGGAVAYAATQNRSN